MDVGAVADLRGVRDAARAGNCTVVGGDVARTPGPLVVTVTALGEAPRRPLCRSGLRAGDALHVSGPLGGSALGHHLRFKPRNELGCWLATQKAATAAIDISDGLSIDLATMLEASGGLGAILDVDSLPITAAARRAAQASGRDPLSHALGDGEDHELLFAVRGSLAAGGPLGSRARRPVGQVTAAPGIELRRRDGSRAPCTVVGYQHDV